MPARGAKKEASTKKPQARVRGPSAAAPVNRPASYSLHIQPVFTASQKACMSGMINLGDYNDVKANAEDIYSRLADLSMPADDTRPWPNEWIALFRRWIDEGCAA
jgi:hypothetical protein